MHLDIGTPKAIDFSFVPNGTLMVLDVPKLKHIRVYTITKYSLSILLFCLGANRQNLLNKLLIRTVFIVFYHNFEGVSSSSTSSFHVYAGHLSCSEKKAITFIWLLEVFSLPNYLKI